MPARLILQVYPDELGIASNVMQVQHGVHEERNERIAHSCIRYTSRREQMKEQMRRRDRAPTTLCGLQ